MSQQRPKRRYGWWIAAGLLFSVLLIGLRAALPIWHRKRSIDLIEGLGGAVVAEFELLPHARPPSPWWLRFVPAAIAPALDQVCTVHIKLGSWPDAPGSVLQRPHEWLPALRPFPEMKYLDLGWTAIHDEDLAILSELPNLSSLDLAETRVTGSGLKHVQPSALVRLDLSGTAVDDQSLSHLALLTELESLSLDRTKITDAGLKHLARLPKLRELSVSNTQVTSEGLEELHRLNSRIGVSDD